MILAPRLLRLTLAVTVGSILTVVAAHLYRVDAQAGPKQLAVFSRQATYSIPLVDMQGTPYVGLVELLEPLGSVEARREAKKYKLQFTPTGGTKQELQFSEGKLKGKVRGSTFTLAATFAFQGQRGYIPLASVTSLLGQMLLTEISLHPASQRLFIGVPETRYSLDLRKGTPS